MSRITSRFIDFGTGSGQVSAQSVPVLSTPVNYTPIQEGSEGTNKISAHLHGIDAALANANSPLVATISTTDNTSTLLQTVTPANNQVLYFEAIIFAVQTGGTAGLDGDAATFKRSGVIKNVGGVATLGTVQSNYSNADDTLWNINFSTDGSSLLVYVMGADNMDVNWQIATQTFVFNF